MNFPYHKQGQESEREETHDHPAQSVSNIPKAVRVTAYKKHGSHPSALCRQSPGHLPGTISRNDQDRYALRDQDRGPDVVDHCPEWSLLRTATTPGGQLDRECACSVLLTQHAAVDGDKGRANDRTSTSKGEASLVRGSTVVRTEWRPAINDEQGDDLAASLPQEQLDGNRQSVRRLRSGGRE